MASQPERQGGPSYPKKMNLKLAVVKEKQIEEGHKSKRVKELKGQELISGLQTLRVMTIDYEPGTIEPESPSTTHYSRPRKRGAVRAIARWLGRSRVLLFGWSGRAPVRLHLQPVQNMSSCGSGRRRHLSWTRW